MTREDVYRLLENVRDPEIPALSVIDMAIVRDVAIDGDRVTIRITPTYSGCPAMKMIADDIVAELEQNGASAVTIDTVFSPPWTTDWLSDSAKEKLRQNAISPPHLAEVESFVTLPRKKIACPFCSSYNTTMRSEFGSTACKSLCFCNACQQPFEYFKAI